MATQIKTIEFKLYLNREQEAKIERWLNVQRWVWNQGLEMLKEFEPFAAYNKADKTFYPCCPVPWEYRWEKDGDQWVAIPFSRIDSSRRKDEYRQCCPIPRAYIKPRLDSHSSYSLMPFFAHKLHHDKLWFTECPYKLTQGTIHLLGIAWQQYKKGARKSPKFKPEKSPLKALNDVQSGNVLVKDGYVRLTKLGWIKLRGGAERWGDDRIVKTCRIIKEPSGYYVMLVGEFEVEQFKPSDKACGIDPGVTSAIALDNGNQYKPARPIKIAAKRMKRLQRKASRQKLKSKNWEKTQDKIRLLHEKIRRSRKSFNHQLSTKIVQNYGFIAFENTKLPNMTRRPKAKLKDDGKGYAHNGARRKAGINRSLSDVAIGQLRTMTQDKASRHDRIFELVPAPNSSRECHGCKVKGDRRKKFFKCLNPECRLHGVKQDADTNASRNHLLNSSLLNIARYPAWAGELKSVERESALSDGDVPSGESNSRKASRSTRQKAARQPHGGEKSPNPSKSSVKPKSAQEDCTQGESFTQLRLWDDSEGIARSFLCLEFPQSTG